MAKKKKEGGLVASAFSTPNTRPDPDQVNQRTAQITGDELPKSKGGRPKAQHGLKRTSILADPEQMLRLKMKALKERRHMYELFNDAIEAYLKDNGADS